MSVVEIEVGTVGLILDPGKHAESRGIFQRGQRDTVRGIILPECWYTSAPMVTSASAETANTPNNARTNKISTIKCFS